MFFRTPSTLLSLLILLTLTGCQHYERPPGMVQPEIGPILGPFQRQDPNTPFLTTRLYYGDANNVAMMIRSQDDPVGHFRGLHRVGDGIVSVGLKNGRGRWLRTHECGGHLFVEAKTGEPCQIIVRNESRSRLEIVVALDGKDVLTGNSHTLHNAGLVLQPGETQVIGRVKSRTPQPLTFGLGRPDPGRPVIHPWMRSANGTVVLAAFADRDRLPWEGTHRTRRSAPMDKFPSRTYEPEGRTFEYR